MLGAYLFTRHSPSKFDTNILSFFRTKDLLYSQPSTSNTNILENASLLASEGHHLRADLASWQLRYHPRLRSDEFGEVESARYLAGNDQGHTILSAMFFSAASIYLSGNFDYDLPLWQSLGIAVPILPTDQVLEHAESILVLVQEALSKTSLSPLLFLFPLRIAGARARFMEQRSTVVELLRLVSTQFAVAREFIEELKQLWKRGSPHIEPINA
jgi:hypothetical protein